MMHIYKYDAYICVCVCVYIYIYIYIYNACKHAKSLQSCPTLYDLMNCSLPGSSVHWILQARILEWVAMSSSLAGVFFTSGAT